MARRRVPRVVRIGLWSIGGLLALLVVVVAVAALAFDPDSLKPRIEAAVKQATGRDLTIDGHLRLAPSLQPTLIAQGVSLSNSPGFSRPQMITLERLDLKLALLPLLHRAVEIDRLVLVKPDIILETDAQGRPNWQFTPSARPPTQPLADTAAQERQASRISAADVRIEDGTITWRDGRTNRSAILHVASLRASAPSPDANLTLNMNASYDGAGFVLSGEVGPLARLEDGAAGAAWPVHARLEAAGATFELTGTMAQPAQARGYRMQLAANVPDLAALGPFVPAVALPPLHSITLAAQVADTGAATPEVSGLTLHIGASELGGLRLDKLDVAAPRLDQPVQVSAQGSLDGAPASLSGSLGAPAPLLSGARAIAPVPLDLAVHALGSAMTVKGTAARGADGRPSVQAVASAEKIDLDAILAALKQPVPAAGQPASPPPAGTPAKPAPAGHMIPDTPLPLGALRLADADVKLNAAQLIWGGVAYRAINGHLELRGGKLRLDPLSADLPEGHVDAVLSVDAAQATPAVAMRLQSPGLALAALLAALKEPAYATGAVQVHADLRGNGATPHAIASTLEGTASLAMGGGSIDNRLLGSSLGSVLRAVNLLDLVGRGGASEIKCFAANIDAKGGIAALRSFVFASSLLTMDGSGSVNLGAETLDLRVRPQARVAGTGIIVPLRITGPWRSPATTPDAASAVTDNAGTVAGAVLGNATPFGALAGALGSRQAAGAPGGCNSASATPSLPAQQPKPPNVGGVLKQLFR